MPTLAERRFTNTDADGAFSEAGLSPGTWQVQAFPGIESLQSEDGGSLDQATLLAALEMQVVELADEAEEHVVLGAPPEDPVQVHGRVTLDDEPLTDSIISFVAAGGGGMESLQMESLDEDGRYSLQLDEPGNYLITVQTAGVPGRQNSIEFRRTVPKAESHQLDFELPLARVSGRVSGPDGEPLAEARVTLTVQGGLVFGTVFGGQYSETVTDDGGAYEIAGLRPGATPWPRAGRRSPACSAAARRPWGASCSPSTWRRASRSVGSTSGSRRPVAWPARCATPPASPWRARRSSCATRAGISSSCSPSRGRALRASSSIRGSRRASTR